MPGPTKAVSIRPLVLSDPEVEGLVAHHRAHSLAATPQTSNHTFGVDELTEAKVTLFGAYLDARLVGCGGLKPLGAKMAEVKSVHVLEAARGSGVARQLMAHLHDAARARGIRVLVLETGSDRLEQYAAARRLYERLGYSRCGPIPGYSEDPNSSFMRLALDHRGKARN